MIYTTLISADEFAARIDSCLVIDARHDLADPAAGANAYAAGHIPGAIFLHQDQDLAGSKDGRNGRHPLPARATLTATLRRIGLSTGRQIVAYDGQGGAYAARLWWLARWLGHAEVAVLDGGIAAWVKAGYPLATEIPAPRPGNFVERASLMPQVDSDEVLAAVSGANRAAPARQVLDARSAERYAGLTEPYDPVAGHIPTALNRFHGGNLRPDGLFKPAAVLRAEFAALLGDRAPNEVVHQCGSGITAIHNLLAMEVAGLGGSALYPGSWSEWCSDTARPVATGPTP